ncbi:MAG: U32 family peptidase [Bauldia sp.]|nr:U32 family peptidase [Bauldia sp.]
MALTLGPLAFNWSPTAWRDFYFRIADEAPVADVYVGEVVCSKRSIFTEKLYPPVVNRLATAGKRVIRSTLATVFLPGDRAIVAQLCSNPGELVEANDVAALFHLRGRRHHIGPFLNVYNERTLEVLVRQGADNVCLPAEIPADVIRRICTAARASGATVEVQSFGRMSLAVSGRCYHARAHGKTRDGCQFVCDREPDGLLLETRDDVPFLVVNGNQVLSFTWLNLLGAIGDLRRAGVTRLRLAPHSCDMVQVARIFRRVADEDMSGDEGIVRLRAVAPDATFANGFLAGRPGHSWVG